MKMLAFLLLFFTGFGAFAQNLTKADFLKNYADFAHAQYQAAHQSSVLLHAAIQNFVAQPSTESMDQAKLAWIEARKTYLPTEVLRFSEGPIDREGGPEPFMNSWPLDEASIDYVLGNQDSGIINDKSIPNITKEVLLDLNLKAGETNVTTGYHAIEFLLWGQDVSAKGPGKRSFNDYLDQGGQSNADRRRQYLLAAAEILESQLQGLVEAWDPVRADSYYNFILSPANQEAQTKVIFEALIKFTGEELSQERMFVAYDTQQQEEEHSCFSDTTHLDFIYDFKGVRSLLDAGILGLVQSRTPDLLSLIQSSSLEAENAINHIPVPFDQAILDEAGRKNILKAITGLEQLSDSLKQAAASL